MDTAAINNMDKVYIVDVILVPDFALQDMLKLQVKLLTQQLGLERKPVSETIRE